MANTLLCKPFFSLLFSTFNLMCGTWHQFIVLICVYLRLSLHKRFTNIITKHNWAEVWSEITGF